MAPNACNQVRGDRPGDAFATDLNKTWSNGHSVTLNGKRDEGGGGGGMKVPGRRDVERNSR